MDDFYCPTCRAAQHRIEVLRSTIGDIQNYPHKSEFILAWCEEALASPDNTAELDALIKDAEQWRKRFYRQLTTNNDAAWGKFEDAQRLNWLEANPRHAQMLIDGKATDCVFYGISCAELVKLRDAIDAAMKADK